LQGRLQFYEGVLSLIKAHIDNREQAFKETAQSLFQFSLSSPDKTGLNWVAYLKRQVPMYWPGIDFRLRKIGLTSRLG
jgi:hypothetical protein